MTDNQRKRLFWYLVATLGLAFMAIPVFLGFKPGGMVDFAAGTVMIGLAVLRMPAQRRRRRSRYNIDG